MPTSYTPEDSMRAVLFMWLIFWLINSTFMLGLCFTPMEQFWLCKTRNYRMFYYNTFRPNKGDFGPTMNIELAWLNSKPSHQNIMLAVYVDMSTKCGISRAYYILISITKW